MLLNQILIVGLLGFCLYPFLANSSIKQRQNACLTIACLCLGSLLTIPTTQIAPLGNEHAVQTALITLSYLFVAGSLLGQSRDTRNLRSPNLQGLGLTLLGFLITLIPALNPSIEHLAIATLGQICCLLGTIQRNKFVPHPALITNIYFCVLFPITALAVKLSADKYLAPSNIENFTHALYGLLLSSALVNMLIHELASRRLKHGAHVSPVIEPAAMKVAYRSRRILKDFRHDLRQPLSTLGILASVGRAISKDPEVASRYTHIQTAQKALKNMLEEFFEELDSSIRYPFVDNVAPMKMVHLHGILQPLIEEYRLLAQAKGIELRYAKTDHEVTTNTEALTKILRNGLDNAIKYTDHGGVVVGIRNRGDCLLLQIVDTGPGVDTNPNLQRHKGWGHGSTIVQDLSDQILAPTECRNRIQLNQIRGSVFEICLPKTFKKLPADQEGLKAHSSALSAHVIGFSKDALNTARLHFPADGFDQVNYVRSNKYRCLLRAARTPRAQVYVAFSESPQDTSQARDCLHTLRALRDTEPCCILIYPSTEPTKKRVNFASDVIEIAYPPNQLETAFKALAEMFPSRAQPTQSNEKPSETQLELA